MTDDLIDRRQRKAACLLLMAFNLPAEARAAARQMQQAARVCPGIKMDEIGSMGSSSRLENLHRARILIEELLAEPESPAA